MVFHTFISILCIGHHKFGLQYVHKPHGEIPTNYSRLYNLFTTCKTMNSGQKKRAIWLNWVSVPLFLTPFTSNVVKVHGHSILSANIKALICDFSFFGKVNLPPLGGKGQCCTVLSSLLPNLVHLISSFLTLSHRICGRPERNVKSWLWVRCKRRDTLHIETLPVCFTEWPGMILQQSNFGNILVYSPVTPLASTRIEHGNRKYFVVCFEDDHSSKTGSLPRLCW